MNSKMYLGTLLFMRKVTRIPTHTAGKKLKKSLIATNHYYIHKLLTFQQ